MNEPDPKILEDTSPDVSPQEEPQRDSLETILARPGVKEMMEVYGNWHELNKIVDTHLSIYRGGTSKNYYK